MGIFNSDGIDGIHCATLETVQFSFCRSNQKGKKMRLRRTILSLSAVATLALLPAIRLLPLAPSSSSEPTGQQILHRSLEVMNNVVGFHYTESGRTTTSLHAHQGSKHDSILLRIAAREVADYARTRPGRSSGKEAVRATNGHHTINENAQVVSIGSAEYIKTGGKWFCAGGKQKSVHTYRPFFAIGTWKTGPVTIAGSSRFEGVPVWRIRANMTEAAKAGRHVKRFVFREWVSKLDYHALRQRFVQTGTQHIALGKSGHKVHVYQFTSAYEWLTMSHFGEQPIIQAPKHCSAL